MNVLLMSSIQTKTYTIMKKVIVFAILLFAIALTSNAQVRFGVKAGANLSNFSTEANVIDQIKGANNYQFGILFQAKLFMFTIQPEVLYSVKGGDLHHPDFTDPTGSPDIEFRSQNIEVPVNLQLGLRLGPIRGYVQAGPYFSYMTGGEVNGETETFDTFVEDFDLNNVDYGVGFGAGAELFNLQLAVRYDLGFKPIGMKFTDIAAQNPFSDLKNRNINISLAYLF